MFYVGLVLYILSIPGFFYSFHLTGGRHFDSRAERKARHRFYGALGMFVFSTIWMSFYSLWFALPIALLIVFVVVIVLYDQWRWR